MADRERELLNNMSKLIHKDDELTPEEVRLHETLDIYMKEFYECEKIFWERNKIYKNTFEYLGLLGTVITLIGDVYRLRNMIVQESDHGRQYKEQIEDKLRDIVNQALISLMMLHDDNFEGT
jgi:hypothetical protein